MVAIFRAFLCDTPCTRELSLAHLVGDAGVHPPPSRFKFCSTRVLVLISSFVQCHLVPPRLVKFFMPLVQNRVLMMHCLYFLEYSHLSVLCTCVDSMSILSIFPNMFQYCMNFVMRQNFGDSTRMVHFILFFKIK